MKQFIKSCLVLLLCIISLSKVTAQNCTVNAQSLNIRSSTTADSKITGTLLRGNKVQVVSETTIGSWVKIKSGNIEGYVLKQYLTCTAPKANTANTVWICFGGSAYAYHSNSSCSGLRRCKAKISKVQESEAKATYSRTPCKKCY